MKLKLSTALLAAAALLTPLSVMADQAQNAAEAKLAAVAAYGKLPLSFEPTGSAARFVAHSGGYTVSVGARESSIAITTGKSGKSQTLHFAFDNAAAAPLEATEPQPGVTNYYIGADSSQWRLGVKSYAKLRAQSVYPGIDVVYYGDHRRLEFDFVVAPKADPAAIALAFSGMDKLYKDSNGDLVAQVGGQPVRFARPYAYQKLDGATKPVAADYELAADGKVHLRLGDYDRSAELIVDPVVSYLTYLGGSLSDVANGVAVDSSGSAYVTGKTCSTNFPISTVANIYDDLISSSPGSCDAYVTKLNSAGTGFLYTTIIGGTTPSPAQATGTAIALDSSNNAYITGYTNFTNLPGNVGYTNPDSASLPSLNAYPGGDQDAFIVILSSTGTLVRSTYLGGSNSDSGFGIAVDKATPPNVVVVGQACSNDFPGYNAFETLIEECAAFVTMLDNGLHIGMEPLNGASAMTPMVTAGTPYFFSEFFGGQEVAPAPTAQWVKNTYYPLYAIIEDVESPGNIQIVTTPGVSGTVEPGLPIASPITPWNVTVNGLTTDGTIVWTCLGPSVRPPATKTQANGVAIDPLGDILVAGGSDTANLGAFTGPFGPFSMVDGTGAWILKVSGSYNATTGQQPGAWKYGLALENAPSDGSAAVNAAHAIAVDTAGNAYVTGATSSSIYNISTNAYQPTRNGTSNAFVVELVSSTDVVYATYLGGTGSDMGLGIAVDGSGAAYVTGSTTSTDFPTINPLTFPDGTAITTLQGGTQNAFISKFTTGGSALLFSAYLGGEGSDKGNAIAVDPLNLGNMYVAGTTSSNNLESNYDPSTYTPPQTAYGGGTSDAFVAMVAGASLPAVTITPASLNFGAQDVGLTSAPMLVLYRNSNASSSVTINSITFGGIDPGDFMQVFPGTAPGDCAPGVIQPSTPCNIWVVFTPAAGQARSAKLYISDSTSSTPFAVTLSGTGEVPQDAFTPTSLTFAASVPQTIGSPTAAQTVTLNNTGQGILDISGIAITGTNLGDFGQTNTCQAQLPSGSSCIFSVIFTPSASGTRTAYLTITDNSSGSPHYISLQGTGAQVVAPTITPLTLTFNAQPLGVTSAPQTVTVTNNDTASNLSLSTSVSAGDFAVAALTGSCGAFLAPKASCVIGVTFTPAAACSGSSCTGSLSIYTNAALSAVVVQLSGTSGVAASGTISLSPTTVPFGNQLENTTSTPAQTVTLTNSSTTATLTVTSIAISGNTDFAIATTSCAATPFTLAASTSCNVTLTFTPKTLALETATLTVTDSASNSPQQVTLMGTGTSTIISPAPFTVTPQSSGVSITQNGTAQYTLSVAPLNGFANSINFTCSGPNGSSCSIAPNPLTMDGITVKTATLSVVTTGGSGAMSSARFAARPVLLALLPFSMMGLLLIGKRRGYFLVLVLIVLCLLFAMVGCGGGSSGRSSSGLAPGTYQVLVTATSSANTAQSQTMTLSLVVTPQ
jgi:hypothetical protein